MKKLALIVCLLAAVVVIGTQTNVLADTGFTEYFWDLEPCVCG